MIVFHYTSIGTLRLILQNKTLRLTNMDNLMDTSEYRYGVELLKQSVIDFESKNLIQNGNIDLSLFDRFMFTGQLYSTSATENRDDINFWNSYYVPKNEAVAIGFDKDLIFDNNLVYNRCIYGNPYPPMDYSTYLWFKGLFNNPLTISKDLNFIRITYQTALIKAICFKSENEWRAIGFPLRTIQHQNKGQIICSYFDYPINTGAIKSITIGPGSQSQSNILKVKDYIKEYIPNANLLKSIIPMQL